MVNNELNVLFYKQVNSIPIEIQCTHYVDSANYFAMALNSIPIEIVI